jgi:hypothetical protein
MLKFPAEYDRDTSSAKFRAISRQIYFPLLPVVSAGYCQRALVDESGTIRTQMGTQNTLKNGRGAWDALCNTTHYSNSNPRFAL